MKEAIRMANFDNQRRIPDQIWYDSLRQTDDGRHAQVERNRDTIDYQFDLGSKEVKRNEYLRKTTLGLQTVKA